VKRLVTLTLVVVLLTSLTGCTAPTKTINNVTYSDYGLLTTDDRNPDIQYEPNWWNIVVGVIFCELIIPPIYVFGFHLTAFLGQRQYPPKRSVFGGSTANVQRDFTPLPLFCFLVPPVSSLRLLCLLRL
jgi:hypothetical protein